MGKMENKYTLKDYIEMTFLIVGLICVDIGTTYTNYGSLSDKVNWFVAALMSVGLTIGFNYLMRFRYKSWGNRVSVFAVMFLSSFLAINTMSKKEIINKESRVSSNLKLSRLYTREDNLTNQINHLLELQETNEAKEKSLYSDGLGWAAIRAAKKAVKVQDERIIIQTYLDTLTREIKLFENQLDKSGSHLNEANLKTFSDLFSIIHLKISQKFISTGGHLAYSLINDFLICLLWGILIIKFPVLALDFGKEKTAKNKESTIKKISKCLWKSLRNLFRKKRKKTLRKKKRNTEENVTENKLNFTEKIRTKSRKSKGTKKRRRLAQLILKYYEQYNKPTLMGCQEFLITQRGFHKNIPKTSDISDIKNGRYPYLFED